MMSKKWFWVVMSLLALTGIVISVLIFDNAFPIVNVPIDMDKNMAISESDSLTTNYFPDIKEYRSSAIFDTDQDFKNYTELKGGGVDSLQAIMNAGIYSPYTWKVRQFTPGEVTEIVYTFTPQGNFYGMNMTLPDSLPGKNILKENLSLDKISGETAKLIPDLQNYELIEHSSELKAGGRRDHDLTYERQDVTLKNARYRIVLRISGDRLTKVSREVKIPESFSLEFKEMRSVNNTVAATGEIVMIVLYGLLGIAGAWIMMMKRRTLQLRGPLTWAIVIAVLISVAGLTSMPLTWFGYDTSLSSGQFIFQNIISSLLQGVLIGVIFFLSATAGEGLGRQAFPHHLHLWKVWSRDTGASNAVLGQTVFGYMWALFMVGFITLFYWFTNNVLGWWSPAENMMDPNILGMSLPWLSPAAMSTQAGFWEETLFRAVPLAGAVVIGSRFKRKTPWIVLVLILQAVIFGAMHANYAQQPAYARIVEMLIPFVLYGLVYLNWGLLPVVVSHFVYDIVLMEMPLFLVSAPGIWFSRVMAVACALIPLAVVLVLRWRRGEKYEITAKDMNMGVVAAPRESAEENSKETPPAENDYRRSSLRILLVLILAGAGTWLGFTQFKADQKHIDISREEALEIAADFAAKNIDDSLLVTHEDYILLDTWNKKERLYIWEEEGDSVYREIFDTRIPVNYYNVNYKSYRGTALQKAEQLVIYLDGKGAVSAFTHVLPESAAGAQLEEADARRIAERELEAYSGLPVSRLDPVSVTPEKLENRTDWLFVYRDTTCLTGSGDIRYKVGLNGDRLSRLSTRVHIPEEWERENKKAGVLKGVLKGISGFMSFALLVGVLVMGIISLTRKDFSMKTFWVTLISLFLANLLSGFLSIDAVMAGMPTTVIFQNIVVILVFSLGIGVLIMALIYAVTAGYLFQHTYIREKNNLHIVIMGLAGGLCIAGLRAVLGSQLMFSAPVLATFDNAASLSPLVSNLVDIFARFVRDVVKLASIVVIVNVITKNWTKGKAWGILFFLFFGMSYASAGSAGTWILGAVLAGAVYLALYLLIFRQNVTAVPWACAVVIVLDTVKLLILNPVAGTGWILWLSIVEVLVLALISHYFVKGVKTEQAAG